MKVLKIDAAPAYGAKMTAPKKLNNNQQKENSVQIMPESNLLSDKNYGILQTKPMNIAFKGGLPPVPAKSTAKKLNNVFNILRSNDIIVTAPNYEYGLGALKKNVDNIKTVIKRVFFIEDKSLNKAIGFKKNLDQKIVINLDEKPLIIKDAKNKTGFLNPGENGYIIKGDTVNVGQKEIKIIEDDTVDLPIKDSFNYFLDLDKEVEPKIKEINEQSLSKVKTTKEEPPKERKITFADVGGMEDTIKELKHNILFPIKHPEIKNGKNMRKSILLYGPPGTGKSFMAEACANEAGAWFKKINASELDSKWVGESEENWRNLFSEARKNQPSIIFIDEIDAIAKKRGGQDTYGDKTLNTILGLMSDSEKKGDQIYMLAATNKKELLDDAATRAGRFGLSVEVKSPDLKGTEDILDKYICDEPVDKNFHKSDFVEQLHKNNATGGDIAAFAEDARTAALDRERIFEKMDEGTYTPKDMDNLRIIDADFEKALDILKSNKKSAQRRPIGFNSELYK